MGSKKAAEVAVKAGRAAIEWDGMAKLLVSEEARMEFSFLRRAFDEVTHALQTEVSQEWNWLSVGAAYCKSVLTVRNGIGSRLVQRPVSLFSRLMGHRPMGPVVIGIVIPKYVDTVTPQCKPKSDPLLVELKEAEEKSLKESERLEKEIAEVQELKKKFSSMTANEYFEKDPELKKKFDDDMRHDYWGY